MIHPLAVRSFPALLLVLLTGCGLSDYEGRMSSARALLQQRDEEAKYLGNPVEMPKLPLREGKEQPSWAIFLRLPKEAGDKPVPQANLYREMFADYQIGKGDLVNVYLGLATDQKEFVKEVLQLFPPVGDVRTENVSLHNSERQITLSRSTLDDNSQTTLSINFLQQGKTQVVVVFRVKRGGFAPKNGKPNELSKAVDLSLLSLGVDTEALKLRADFDKFHKKG